MIVPNKDIASFSKASMSSLLAERYLAPGPMIARDRIRERWRCDLSHTGTECIGISTIRDLVSTIDESAKFARAILIAAPHTHWGNVTIVESYDPCNEVYMIGPSDAFGELRPFSFVFSADGPIPFEFADESVNISTEDLEELYGLISELNLLIVREFGDGLPIPLGVTINHRFKETVWGEQLFTSVEGPQDTGDGRAIVEPMVESIVHPNPESPDRVQVAWPSLPSSALLDPDLSNEEAAVLLKLEETLRTRTPKQALRFIEELEEETASADLRT